jgi:hypothetical protein
MPAAARARRRHLWRATAARTDDMAVIVVTSPVPSNPSVAMLRDVLESVLLCCDGASGCTLVIVSDGLVVTEGKERPKRGAVHGHRVRPYEAFRAAVDAGAAGWWPDAPAAHVRSAAHVGFARCVALGIARAPQAKTVLVVQHDRACVRRVDLPAAAAAMKNPEVRYVGLPTAQSLARTSAARAADLGLRRPPPARPLPWSGAALRPLCVWYDSTHLIDVGHFLDFVLPRCGGSFPEDTVGQDLLHAVKHAGDSGWAAAHAPYACYLWIDAGDATAPAVAHLRGRSAVPAVPASVPVSRDRLLEAEHARRLAELVSLKAEHERRSRGLAVMLGIDAKAELARLKAEHCRRSTELAISLDQQAGAAQAALRARLAKRRAGNPQDIEAID